MSILTKHWIAYIGLMVLFVMMTCTLWSVAIKDINDEKAGYDEPIYISQQFDIVCTGGNNYHITGALTNLSSKSVKIDKITLKLSAPRYKGEYDIENITISVYNTYYVSKFVKSNAPDNTNINIDNCYCVIDGVTRKIKYSPNGKNFSNSENIGLILGGCACLIITILIFCALKYRYKLYKRTGM